MKFRELSDEVQEKVLNNYKYTIDVPTSHAQAIAVLDNDVDFYLSSGTFLSHGDLEEVANNIDLIKEHIR